MSDSKTATSFIGDKSEAGPMEQGSALTASGRAARHTAANGCKSGHGLANSFHATANAGTATKAYNRRNAFAPEPANV